MLATILLLASTLLPPSGETPRINALRVTAAVGAPTIDGRLNDAVWTAADSLTNFVQVQPAPGQPSQFRTVARIAYDEKAVYVAIRAYDPEPNKIIAQRTPHDQDSPSDWVAISFDSHLDHRTAYGFWVNPLGSTRDMMIRDNAGPDFSWTTAWDVATHRDEHGWSAEFRLPLSALRFSTEGQGVWGVQIVRVVARTGEFSAWSPERRRDNARLVADFGELHGLTDLLSQRVYGRGEVIADFVVQKA